MRSWGINNGQRTTDNGKWTTDSGKWAMDNGQLTMHNEISNSPERAQYIRIG